MKKAVVIVIGNEILSGKTQDKNINFIATELSKIGVSLEEVRIIPDIMDKIIDTINEVRTKNDYIITTGGIGPTHDDITSEAISRAFNEDYTLHKEAEIKLRSYYKTLNKEVTQSRLRMAFMPKNSKLIENPASGAPGFYIENVYVLAGIPFVMQAMLRNVISKIDEGKTFYSRNLEVFIPESEIAEKFGDFQLIYPDIDMGSYPFYKENQWGTNLVLRSQDNKLLNQVEKELKKLFNK